MQKRKFSDGVYMFCVILLAVSGLMATDIYLPSLPAIMHHTNLSQSQTQMTLTLFLFGFGFSQFFSGIFSDKYGRRIIVLLSICIFIFGSSILIFANNVAEFYVGRLIQGIGIGAATALSRVIIRDIFNGEKLTKVLAQTSLFIGIAPALAPVFGSILQEYFGYRSNFIFLFLYGFILFLMIYYILHETNLFLDPHAIKVKTVQKNIKSLFSDETFILSVLCTGLGFSTVITYSAINPFLLEVTYKVTPLVYGMLTFLMVCGMLIGYISNALTIKYFSPSQKVIFGFALISIASVILLVTQIIGLQNISVIVIATFFASAGTGFIFPNCAYQAFLPFPRIAGIAGSIYGSSQIIISSITSFIISSMALRSQFDLAIIFMVIAGLGGFLAYRLMLQGNQEVYSGSVKIS